MRPTTGGIPLAALEVVPQGPTPRSPLRPDRRAPRQTTTAHEGVCVMREQNSELAVYSSSSSASSSPPFAAAAALARLRLTRPARAPPYGEVSEKSMCWRWAMGEVPRRGGRSRRGAGWRGGEVGRARESRTSACCASSTRGEEERAHLLRVKANDERRDVDDLLADAAREEVRAGSAPATKLARLGGPRIDVGRTGCGAGG